MIHFQNATIHFATVVSAVEFGGQAGGAEAGAAVRVANENGSMPERDIVRQTIAGKEAACRFFGGGKAAVVGHSVLWILVPHRPSLKTL